LLPRVYELTRRLGPLGFGGGALGNLYHVIDDGQAAQTVMAALANGWRDLRDGGSLRADAPVPNS